MTWLSSFTNCCTQELAFSLLASHTRFCYGRFTGTVSLPISTSAVEHRFKESESSDSDDGNNSGTVHDKGVHSSMCSLSRTDHQLTDGARPESDLEIFQEFIKACSRLKKLKEGKVIHAHILCSKYKSDIFIHNSILTMYSKCGSLTDAQKVFDAMPLNDIVSWTALIAAYSQNDKPEEALRLFPKMLLLGLRPNHFTFASLLKACGSTSEIAHGRQVHTVCIKCCYSWNVYVGSALLDMYTKCGCMNEAHLVFEGLDSRNEVTWNALIAGYARKGHGEDAIKHFCIMQRAGFRSSHFTYSSIFSGCAGIGALEPGKWVHAHMIKAGEKLAAFVGNTLVDMYAKSGSIEDARKVFDRLQNRDVVSWNSILIGCAQHGLGREAIDRFEHMQRSRIVPNEITFLCVLTACSHSGLLNEGQHCFHLMKIYRIEPKIEHYVAIVDLLGRAGLLLKAESFIIKLPIEPTAAIWGALLGACRMHKNMELGVLAAERVFELDPYDSGPHVILANLYASQGRWSDVSRVRKMMTLSGVKKEPACSWVEIENSVHIFVANDDSHPRNEEIRRMWDSVCTKIREIGYVPDTDNVLLFVDKQDREAKLQHHSEKLALAFALLSTPHGATIRIKKNIRMCGDCHSAIKLVSKVVEREIIVRDTHRYHHFRHGYCSCGDYW